MRSAKYIEGLENRLGRMEHLLKLSGESTLAVPHLPLALSASPAYDIGQASSAKMTTARQTSENSKRSSPKRHARRP